MKYHLGLSEDLLKAISIRNKPVNIVTKFCILAIFSICLWLFKFPLWKEISFFIAIANINWFQNQSKFFAIFNILLWVSTGSFIYTSFGATSPKVFDWPSILTRLNAPSYINVYVSYLAIGLCFYFLYKILFSILNRFRINQPVWTALTVLVGLHVVFDNVKNNPVINWIFFGLLLAYSKAFWMMIYQLSERDFLKKYPVWQHFATISPPWQQSWAKYSVLRGFSDFLNNRISSETDLIKNQIGALKLIIWALILKVITIFLYQSIYYENEFFGYKLSLSEYIGRKFSLDSIISNELGAGWLWAYVLSICFLFLMNLAATTHVVVAVARMCGYMVEKNFNEPYKAHTFNNFLYRIYYYYIAIIMRVFYFPLWSRLRFISHKKTRIFLVSFLTILFGGIIDSILKKSYLVLLNEADFTLSILQNRSPYFTLLAIFSGISAVLAKKDETHRSFIKQGCMFCLYFILFSICFFTQQGNGTVSFSVKINLLARLFGF